MDYGNCPVCGALVARSFYTDVSMGCCLNINSHYYGLAHLEGGRHKYVFMSHLHVFLDDEHNIVHLPLAGSIRPEAPLHDSHFYVYDCTVPDE